MNTDAREEVRSRTDIADIVSRHVKLKQAGKNLSGLCPFHKEKSPSFTVSPERGTYHCFGCGAGGDVFKFVMETEGLSFPETLRKLADECGVKIERSGESFEREDKGLPRDILIAIHEEAAVYFYSELCRDTSAQDYFKNRGITGATAKEFQLGFAPSGWSGIIDALGRKGFTPDQLTECGLAIASSKGEGHYDRFRERIMFPIQDGSGRVIAFSGRAMNKDAQAKYVNSPETAIYHKSKVLYGLHPARQGIRETGEIIIVEGYMDWLAMWQAGVRNAVASCGTALTEEHAVIIARLADKVRLLFDGDKAGIAAAEKAIAVLAPNEIEISVSVLPGEADPDSFIREKGAEAFKEELLSSSQRALTFLLARATIGTDPQSPHSQSAAFRAVEPYLKTVTDNILRSAYIRETAETLKIDESLVYERLGSHKPSRPAQSPPKQFRPEPPPKPTPAPSPANDPARVRKYLNTEDGSFIHLLVRYPKLIPSALNAISPADLTGKFSAKLYSYVADYSQHTPDLVGIAGDPDDDTMTQVLSQMLVSEITLDSPDEEMAHKCARLHHKRLQDRKKVLATQLASETDPQQRAHLLKEQEDLAKEIIRKRRAQQERSVNTRSD